MPSLPFFALALAMSLPKPIAWAALLFHAIASWPAALASYERPGLWRLHGFPWQAALRLQSEQDYLRAGMWDFRVAEMLNSRSRLGAKILGLATLSNAYIDREVIQYWQSAAGTHLREMLLEAAYTVDHPLYSWTVRWPPRPLRAIRVRALTNQQYEW